MIEYLKWLFNFRCKHERRRGIYGDEINMAGGYRGACIDCPMLFPSLPTEEQNWWN